MKTHISTKMAGYSIYLAVCIYVTNQPFSTVTFLGVVGLILALIISICEELS